MSLHSRNFLWLTIGLAASKHNFLASIPGHVPFFEPWEDSFYCLLDAVSGTYGFLVTGTLHGKEALRRSEPSVPEVEVVPRESDQTSDWGSGETGPATSNGHEGSSEDPNVARSLSYGMSFFLRGKLPRHFRVREWRFLFHIRCWRKMHTLS